MVQYGMSKTVEVEKNLEANKEQKGNPVKMKGPEV